MRLSSAVLGNPGDSRSGASNSLRRRNNNNNNKSDEGLRQDRSNNTELPMDTHNLGGNPEYDYIYLDKLDKPQGQSRDTELDNGAMSGPYSTITDPDISERNPTENATSSTDGREPRVADEIPADAVMEEMDGYGEYGTGGHI
ncbi:hypothetical protein NP493_103g00007 [Ridgeia piscesae]|uniref:Uncharacterized protein n=1 Tax=Ridgeia piscesae TaxID=27915 RepID=A0AAD9P7C9_RIDPI|nr:hypothetical protein NP493_103g00007 [Ridgeia piscesae]